MSLLIKGMDMPKNKGLFYDLLLSLSLDGSGEIFFNGKSYPIVEIPTPHGRLIDADRLYETIEQMEGFGTIDNENDVVLSAVEVLTAIDEAPTIIEAEEEQ